MCRPVIDQLNQRYYLPKREHPYRIQLRSLLEQNALVLDGGCEDGSSFRHDYKDHVRALIGLDLTWEKVNENVQIDYGVVGDLAAIPFCSGRFDLIYSHDVVEHLPEPGPVFGEFARLLRPGGSLLILTPNNYHYFSLAGRILPTAAQSHIARSWLKSTGIVYPTYYRANSASRLRKLARGAGLVATRIDYHEPSPGYLASLPILFLFAFIYERLVNRFSFLAPFRSQLIACFTKPA